MWGEPFTYLEEDGSWNVGAEMWRGGSWGSYYVRLAHNIQSKEAAAAEAGKWKYSIESRQFVRDQKG